MKSMRIVNEIADYAGTSSVAVSIDMKKHRFGRQRVLAPGTPLDLEVGLDRTLAASD